MKHVTYLHNNEEVLSLRKYRIVVVDILKLNDDSCISEKRTKRGLSLNSILFMKARRDTQGWCLQDASFHILFSRSNFHNGPLGKANAQNINFEISVI